MTKRKSFWALALVLILNSVINPAFGGQNKSPHQKAAIVNGTVITQEELDMEMNFWIPTMGKIPDDGQLPIFQKKILERLIKRELLYQDAVKRGIKIEDKAVDDRMETMKKQNFTGEADYHKMLTERSITEAYIRSQLKKSMAIQKLRDIIVGEGPSISENEIRSYYDQHPQAFKQSEKVRVSQIRIKTDPHADKSEISEARKRIEDIQNKLNNGESFEALAREFSEDPSKIRDGDLGYIGRGRMAIPIEQAAFSMKAGEISGIVETDFGFHIIKVTDKTDEKMVPYENAKKRITQRLIQEKKQKEMNKYIAKLKNQGKVEIFLSTK
jgi:peptidyl-prolyl cis-trans isomerase C